VGAPRIQGKAAAWFQPHCGIPGQLEIGWYLNRAGVLTVEHPVPKMKSVQLPVSEVQVLSAKGEYGTAGFPAPNAPAANPIAD
jgi:hypothetical protein